MSHGHHRASAAPTVSGGDRPRIQRVIPIESPRFLPADLAEAPIDWLKIFGRSAPLAVEIGCGTGHFLLQRALQQPEIDFVGIDIYNKGCLKTCKKLDAAGIANVRVMRVEARTLLQQGLSAGSLQALYINCPDPWPKKRHRQRRLVNRDFLELARYTLAPGGDLFFSSDTRDYAEDVAAAFAALPGYRNQLDAPLLHALPGYPLSKYMRRFLGQGLPIHFIHQRREPGFPYEPPAALEPLRGFRSDPRREPHG